MSRQTFLVTITTDGLDGPSDMQDIARAMQASVPGIVRPFVRETEPASVTWRPPRKIDSGDLVTFFTREAGKKAQGHEATVVSVLASGKLVLACTDELYVRAPSSVKLLRKKR